MVLVVVVVGAVGVLQIKHTIRGRRATCDVKVVCVFTVGYRHNRDLWATLNGPRAAVCGAVMTMRMVRLLSTLLT